jgi:hypothetical protein
MLRLKKCVYKKKRKWKEGIEAKWEVVGRIGMCSHLSYASLTVGN